MLERRMQLLQGACTLQHDGLERDYGSECMVFWSHFDHLAGRGLAGFRSIGIKA